MSAHHDQPTTGPDTKAAFLGIIIGAIALFLILYGIVRLTNAHDNNERPAATASK